MKRIKILAIIAAIGIAGSVSVPVQAASYRKAGETSVTKGYYLRVERAGSLEELKYRLDELWQEICKPNTNVTPDIQPDTDAAPDTQPDADVAPDTPDSQPDTDTGTEEVSFAAQVANLVNAERRKAGLQELAFDTQISSAALTRANEIETVFSHTRPDGSSFSTVLKENGISYRGAGENIAWGQTSPEEVMNAWMSSEGHRANILNPNFTKIGVGHRQNASGRNYWVQLFAY